MGFGQLFNKIILIFINAREKFRFFSARIQHGGTGDGDLFKTISCRIKAHRTWQPDLSIGGYKGAEPLYSFLPKGGRTAQGRGLRNRVGQIAAANKIILIFINAREKFRFFSARIQHGGTGDGDKIKMKFFAK